MTSESSAPRFKAPPGSCDCHIHIYGPTDVYPEVPTSPFPVPDAPVSAYREVMARLGLERAVIVQPSAYGFDNRCTLDAMAELGEGARGIAVIAQDTPEDEMERLTGAGIKGLRYHMMPGGLLPWELLEPMASKVHAFDWHVQLQLDGRLLPEKADLLKRLPGKLVIDHTAKFLEPVAPEDPAFRCLLDLVATGRVWVKLSAPYETSKLGPPHFDDVGVLMQRLIRAAPERMLWASNWPHPSAKDEKPDDAMLLDLLAHWAGDEAVTRRILADNPAELYGF